MTKAFNSTLKEGRQPQYLWVYMGKEFYYKHLKELLDKKSVKMYSTENGEKFIVVERWNRTIKQRMWKQFTVQGNTQDLDILPQIVLKYNNTKHSSLKMTPTEASIKKNKGTVYFNLYEFSLFSLNSLKRNMLRWSGKDMMMISTIGYQLRIWLILKKIVYERQKQKIISLISRHMKRRLK